jgi:nucleoid-associated protein YgaU
VLLGVVSASVLLAAVVGVPLALTTIAPDLVNVSEVVNGLPDSLWQPDDGSLFMLALLAVAWVAWAGFTVSVALEVVHATRGLPAPQLPAFGPVQRIAAALVTSAAVLVTPAQALPGQAGPPPPPPVVAAAPVAAGSAASVTVVDRGAVTKPEPAPSGPEIIVARHDTLWSLAEQHLGAGQRYREILTLNLGRPQPDGRTLSEAGVLYPGWRLILPEGATPAASPELARDVDHVVEPGDTLWDIAEDHLGSGERYPEVFDLNDGVVQPDGQRLTDPNLIRVGWELDLPEDEEESPSPTPVAAEPEVEPQVESAVTDEPAAPESAPPASPAVRSPDALHREAAPVEVGTAQTSADDETSVDPGLSSPLPTLVMGMSAVALAGFVGEVARRRTRQRRERHVGERLPMPEPGEQAVERLAAIGASEGPSRTALTETMRALAEGCRSAGRLLPDVLLVLLGREHVDLWLRNPDNDAVEPLTAVDRGRVWSGSLSHARRPAESIDPYPALVSVGTTSDGSTVLANLDALGHLDITGNPEAAARAMSALGLELALAAADGALTLTVAANEASLVDAFVGDPVRRSADVGNEVRSRMDSVAVALTEANCADMRQARSQGACADVQTEVVVSATSIDSRPPPWCGVVVVRLDPEAGGDEWRLECQPDGTGTLLPAGLDLKVQQLGPSDRARLLSVLRLADGECRLPASDSQDEAVAEAGAIDVAEATERSAAALRAAPVRYEGRGQATVSTEAGWLRVNVLGKVEILNAESDLNTSRRERARELLTYLVLNPGASAYELDEALWPGRRIEPSSRNPFISRVRQWVGYASDGELYLPFVRDGSHYQLHDRVTCDWHEFVALSHRGFAAGVDGILDLEAALSLVRGRPFLGIDPGRYTWAEPHIQEMIAAVCDVAHLVSQARAERGEWRAAQHAASIGLLVDPAGDLLFKDAVAAAIGAHDADEVGRLKSCRELHMADLE